MGMMIIDRVARLRWDLYCELESVIDFRWRKLDELDELAGIDWFGMEFGKRTLGKQKPYSSNHPVIGVS